MFCEHGRRYIAQRTVRPDVVVMRSPLLDHPPRLEQIPKPMLVGKLELLGQLIQKAGQALARDRTIDQLTNTFA